MKLRIVFLNILMNLGLVLPCRGESDSERDASEFENSIIYLSATRAVPDGEAPWNIQNIDVTGYVGVVISGGRILAPASLVSRAVFIQGQKMEDVSKIPLKVQFVDYEANLAVLIPAEGTLSGVKPLAIGDELPLNSDVWMLGIENDRQLLRASLRILEVSLRDVVPAGQSFLTYVLTGQNRSTCKGEPLIRQSKVVGMCFGVLDNQPWAITAATIKHFLQDQLDPKTYKGFPVLGLNLGVVKNPHIKANLKWPQSARGLRVVEVNETSAFADDVKANDIITAIDRETLDNRGFIRHPIWGPVPLRHYLSQRYGGDKVTLHFLRDGRSMQASQALRRYNGQDYQIPGLTFEGEMAHLIIGGLVFRELGIDFLSSFGRDWTRSAPTNFLYLFQFKNRALLSRRRHLVLANVLADSFNQGYDKSDMMILEKVNGDVVANLDELRLAAKGRAISKAGEKFIVLEFNNGVQIVLPLMGLKESHLRIAKAYGVTSTRSFLATD